MKELAIIQSRLKAPKGQYNSFGKYKYRSCEDIVEAVKPLLAEQGCALMMSDELVFVGDRYYIKATVTIQNGAGECAQCTALAREEEEKKGMDASQITGTASSYARKYALNGLLAIDDTKDADALNTSADYTKKEPDALADERAMAIQEARGAKSRESLEDVWNNHSALRDDERFNDVMQEMGKKYPKSLNKK